MTPRPRPTLLVGVLLALHATPALAAGDAPHIEDTKLGLVWMLPFAAILLSIVVMPLLAAKFWDHHYGKIAAGWALALVVPFAAMHRLPIAVAACEIAHAVLLEYLPSIILLLAQFTVTGAIRITGNLHGFPSTNAALLAIGTALAS